MKYSLLIIFLPLILGVNCLGQKSTCDAECVRTVRVLLKASYIGISTSWNEKANNRLGDKVGVAITKIYKGKSLYNPNNIRTFLPVIEQSFEYRRVIENKEDKEPVITLRLLKRLKARIKDHWLNREITYTLNRLMFSNPVEVSEPAKT